MLYRSVFPDIEKALRREAAVALLGPRQVGKTTLALALAETRPSVYLDLENRADREKLSDAPLFLEAHKDKLVIIDEIHRDPGLCETLRGVIDRGRREGYGAGRFLLLGSASIELMRQSETLAGRIEYQEMTGLTVRECAPSAPVTALWLRGGFPRSYLADNDEDSFFRRQNFIRTYLERDIPMFGPRIPAVTLERLWTMLAHCQGGLHNASRLARSLDVSVPTVNAYIGLLTDLLLVRRLPPYCANIGKRLVKSPKLYIRDSGLVHALLGIETLDELLGHPVKGASWEATVLENLLAAAPARARASFYRTAKGAEIDLILETGAKHGTWAIEIKHGTAPKAGAGMRSALADIKPDKAFIVYGGEDRYPKEEGIEVIGVREAAEMLAGLR